MNTSVINTTLSASCIAIAMATTSNAAKLEETTTHNLPRDSIQSIEVENINGGIQVEGWERSEIELTYTKKARGGNEERVQEYLDEIARAHADLQKLHANTADAAKQDDQPTLI